MTLHPLAGKRAPSDRLIDVKQLLKDYYERVPDPGKPAERVVFGTSGHRGSASSNSFNDAHVAAIAQAVCEYRRQQNIDGPLYMGRDTHALSEPAERTALEVLAANGVATVIHRDGRCTPTPAISHAILTANRNGSSRRADGIVITPSHNPPEDGGIKYNPPHGGPADTDVTGWIEKRANEILERGETVSRLPYERAKKAESTREEDLITPYVEDLANVVDMAAIRESGPALAVDPLGGASLEYWQRIAERYGLNLTITNSALDPTFAFMTLDHDGKIRMDCSSPHAMASLLALKDSYPLAFGNDPDADRHGVVTPAGLMNPNHYLAVAIEFLFAHRPNWPRTAAIGKTLVSSAIIDRIAAESVLKLVEVPVGFKWFSAGLFDGSLGFGGEESAGASFLRRDGTVWTTDKDGIIMDLLAAEIAAVTGKDPAERFAAIAERNGMPYYARIDQAASAKQKAILKGLTAEQFDAAELADDRVTSVLTRAPGNNAPIGGIKVTTENGWFAARPSGTEDIYKVYAESFVSESHLRRIIDDANSKLAELFARG